MIGKKPKKDIKAQNVRQVSREAELTELVQRIQADFDNYRKRTQKEKDDFAKYLNTDLILRVIPVLDNFQLAANHLPQNLADDNWAKGILHIARQLEQVIYDEGVSKIPTVGVMFDPNLHEAVNEVESDLPPGTIITEILAGYKLQDRIIRHAKVTVSKNSKKEV
jgi:molecular chaperone GrpE